MCGAALTWCLIEIANLKTNHTTVILATSRHIQHIDKLSKGNSLSSLHVCYPVQLGEQHCSHMPNWSPYCLSGLTGLHKPNYNHVGGKHQEDYA